MAEQKLRAKLHDLDSQGLILGAQAPMELQRRPE